MKHLIALVTLMAAVVLGGVSVAEEDQAGGNRLLVAKPSMSDPRFQESVVLITRHGGPSPIGVILNKPTGVHLNDLFSDLPELDVKTGEVFYGGPVSNEVLAFMVETDTEPERALSVADRIYLALDPDLLLDFITHPEQRENFRVYSGYAGWEPGQLEAEIERGDWWEVPLQREYLFPELPEQLWKQLVERLRGKWV